MSDGTALPIGALLIAAVGTAGSAFTPYVPSGWLDRGVTEVGQNSLRVFTRYTVSGEASSYIFSHEGTSEIIQAGIVAVTGIDPSFPIGDIVMLADSADGASITLDGSSMVPEQLASMLIGFSRFRLGSLTNASTVAPPTNYTEKFDFNSGGLSANKSAMECAYRLTKPAGAQASPTWTATESAGARAAIWLEVKNPSLYVTSTGGIPSAEAFGQATIRQDVPQLRDYAITSSDLGANPQFTIPTVSAGDTTLTLVESRGTAATVYVLPYGFTLESRLDLGDAQVLLISRSWSNNMVEDHFTILPTGASTGWHCTTVVYSKVSSIDIIADLTSSVGTTSSTLITAPSAPGHGDELARVVRFVGGHLHFTENVRLEVDGTDHRYLTNAKLSSVEGGYTFISASLDRIIHGASVPSRAFYFERISDSLSQSVNERFAYTVVLRTAPPTIFPNGIPSGEAFGQAIVIHADDPSDPGAFGLGETAAEIVTERTLKSKNFMTDYGTIAHVIGQQLHYQESASFLDLDLDLDTVDATTWRMNKHAFQVEIRAGSGRGVYLTERSTGSGIRIHLPADPTNVTRRRVEFPWHGTTWTYANRKRGIKLSAVYATRQGSRAYTFRYTRLGGAAHPVVSAGGDLVGDAYRIKRMFAEGADGEVYTAGSWAVDASTGTIQTIFDDSVLPDEAFPYTLDPTTDVPRVTLPKDDATVMRTGATIWPPDTASAIAPAESSELTVQASRKLSSSGANRYSRSQGLLRFDTTSVPSGAFVMRAWVRVYVLRRVSASGDGFALGADLHDWADPPTTASYNNAPGASIMPTASFDLSNVAPNSAVDIPINGAALNVGGITELRLNPIVGRTPTGVNELGIATVEHPTAPEPKLIVEYSQGIAPRHFASGNTGAGATFVDVPISSTIQVGDQAFVMMFGGAGTNISTRAAITAPSGWSIVPNCALDYSTYARAVLYTKRITQADRTAGVARWSWTGSRVFSWTLGAYQGAPVNAIETSQSSLLTTSAKTIPGPALTTAGDTERVVMWHGAMMNTNLTPMTNSGLTERAENRSTTSQYYPQALSDFVMPTPGSIGVREYDMASDTASINRLSFAVALRPPLYIYPQSIPSAEAFGQAIIKALPTYLTPQSIPSAEAFGQARVRFVLPGINGIPSAEAFGQAKVSAGVTATQGIPSAEAFGQAIIKPQSVFIQVDGIPSAEEFGAAVIRMRVVSTGGIPTAEAFGQAGVVVETPPAEILLSEEKRRSLLFSGIRGVRKFEPRLFLSNLNGDELRELPGVQSASVDLSNYRDNTWELSLTVEASDAFDPFTDYVIAAMDSCSDLDPWERDYLGLFRFEFPDGTDEPSGSVWNLTGRSIEMLMFRKAPIDGYRVGKNASIFATVRDILQQCGIPANKLTIPPDLHDKRLPQGAKFDPIKDQDNAMYIRIANEVLRMGGFAAIQTTATGQLFFNEIVSLDEKHPDVFYGPSERGADDMIVYVGIPYEADYERFANEILVYNANTTTALTADTTDKADRPAPPIKAIARNTNPDSKVSTLAPPLGLGYTVTKFIQMQDLTDQDAANRIARAELARSSGYHLERKIQTLFDPRRRPDEAYVAEAFNAYGLRILSGKWQQVNVQFPLSKSASEVFTTHTIARTEGF